MELVTTKRKKSRLDLRIICQKNESAKWRAQRALRAHAHYVLYV